MFMAQVFFTADRSNFFIPGICMCYRGVNFISHSEGTTDSGDLKETAEKNIKT
jgi:hypothetical protein